MKDIFKALRVPYEGDIKRIKEDNERMTESSTGAEEIKDVISGKQPKPRAVRDWEKNLGGK